jgi:hypothetical protein
VVGDNGTITATLGQIVRIETTDPTDGDKDEITTGSGADIILGGTSGDVIYRVPATI